MDRRINVLLIDDDPAQCETLADVLGEHGCEVVPCSDPIRGRVLGRSRPFDLVLLDLKMSGLSGLDLIQVFRDHSSPCIVVLTGLADTSMKRAAIAGGADAVMDKPVDIPRLLEIACDVRRTGDCKSSAALIPVP
jgi:DNA-binding response OmpR family regulator